jgi:hypothetical protein
MHGLTIMSVAGLPIEAYNTEKDFTLVKFYDTRFGNLRNLEEQSPRKKWTKDDIVDASILAIAGSELT